LTRAGAVSAVLAIVLRGLPGGASHG